ncbi:37072_t:CDS:2 [Racocetra persica]|uniref:37072_t:CDS:1 n=1 Tax=Racocetra persica TaxID=160502 RepID=A0ACA9Q2A3_9GLOM|nr:37072_t:CDS:2 [Racocetra persica]
MYHLLPNGKFNFEKIKRTEIEQIKQEITNLKKLAIEQSKNIKYLAEAIKIYQEINNTFHLENNELKRKLEEHRGHDYLTRLRQITTWRNQAVAEFVILGQEYLEEKFDKLHKEYFKAKLIFESLKKQHNFNKLYKMLDNLQDTSDEESGCPSTPQQVKEYTLHYTPSTPV